MARVIGVQYEGSARQYSYLASNDQHEQLKVGDFVLVPVAKQGGFPYAVARVLKTDHPEGYERDLPYKLKAIHTVIGK